MLGEEALAEKLCVDPPKTWFSYQFIQALETPAQNYFTYHGNVYNH